MFLTPSHRKKTPVRSPEIRLTEGKFSPPENTDNGFIPYFPGTSYFTKDDIVIRLDESIEKIQKHNKDLQETYSVIEDGNNRSEIGDKVRNEESKYTIGKQNSYHDAFSDNINNDRIVDSQIANQVKEFKEEINPFQSENLVLGFTVETPKDLELSEKNEKKYSDFFTRSFEKHTVTKHNNFNDPRNYTATETAHKKHATNSNHNLKISDMSLKEYGRNEESKDIGGKTFNMRNSSKNNKNWSDSNKANIENLFLNVQWESKKINVKK